MRYRDIIGVPTTATAKDGADLTESDGTTGATCASSIATVAHPLGGIGPGFGGTDTGIYKGMKKKRPLMLRR